MLIYSVTGLNIVNYKDAAVCLRHINDVLDKMLIKNDASMNGKADVPRVECNKLEHFSDHDRKN